MNLAKPTKLLLRLKFLSKSPLFFIPLLLLPYSLCLQALSAQTSSVIQGTAPYLTFDGGLTKSTKLDDSFLSITLSNGTIISPETNTSSPLSPIVLPRVGESFTDIGMLVPPTSSSIALNKLIGAPNNYWKDDDGDGLGTNGITVTGNLTVTITDKNNQTVSRSDVLDICNAPYKVVLNSTDGNLSTQYGIPNSSTFRGGSETYFINPNLPPKVCYAKPNLQFGSYIWTDFRGPADIWNPDMGFLPQSTERSFYGRNFPTTGANNLYFDLDIGGIGQLTWPTVTQGGITATMDPNQSGTSVRVTLTGPAANDSQIQSDYPAQLYRPSLPQTFELVGYDNSGSAIVKYGFELKKWFVNRGWQKGAQPSAATWCSSLGYRIIKVNDVTNAACVGIDSTQWCQGSVGAMPPSIRNHYQRRIEAGFFSEWGYMGDYTGARFIPGGYYWTSDGTFEDTTDQFAVAPDIGHIGSYLAIHNIHALCTYP